MTGRAPKSVREATAHHEAGHAVIALQLNVPFKHVTIAEHGDSAGHVLFLTPARTLGRAHRRGIVSMAGEAAQRRFNPRSIRRHHGEGDRETVVDYALAWSGGSLEAAEKWAQLWDVLATNLVKGRWQTIQQVAAALLERQTLSHKDCRLLLIPQA